MSDAPVPPVVPPPTSCVPGRSKRVAFTVIVMACALALGALLAEGAVRVRHWIKYGAMRSVEKTFSSDPATGLRIPTPNAVIGNIRINSLGFRSPELVSPKPPSTVRLAFLGASTTYSAEVSSNEMTWPHLVWKSLSEALPTARLDYVNAGVPGYGLDHILEGLRLRVAPLQPDVIVIYEATNDLSSDSRVLARRQGLVQSAPDEQGWLSQHSMLWFLAEKNVRVWRLQSRAHDAAGKLVYDPRQLSAGFERRLGALIRASQDVAPVVAVAAFAPRLRRGQPPDVQTRAAVTALYYMPYMSIEGLVAGYEEYNRVIREVTVASGALLIGGENSITADDAHYNDSVHFKDLGSSAMAARVSEALLADPGFRALVASKRAGASR